VSALPPVAPPARQARSQQRRGRVKEVALRIFADQGVEEARVEDIVHAAGVAWGTFFRYFARKEDVLLEAATDHLRENVRPSVEAWLAGGREPARGAALELYRSLATSEYPPHVHGAILREISRHPQRFSEVLPPDEPPPVVLAAQVVARGQERGEVRDDLDALILAAVLSAGTMFPVIEAGFGPALRGLRGIASEFDPGALVERSFGVAWRGLEPL
jgi:AcrR family transcriptional regulator